MSNRPAFVGIPAGVYRGAGVRLDKLSGCVQHPLGFFRQLNGNEAVSRGRDNLPRSRQLHVSSQLNFSADLIRQCAIDFAGLYRKLPAHCRRRLCKSTYSLEPIILHSNDALYLDASFCQRHALRTSEVRHRIFYHPLRRRTVAIPFRLRQLPGPVAAGAKVGNSH